MFCAVLRRIHGRPKMTCLADSLAGKHIVGRRKCGSTSTRRSVAPHRGRRLAVLDDLKRDRVVVVSSEGSLKSISFGQGRRNRRLRREGRHSAIKQDPHVLVVKRQHRERSDKTGRGRRPRNRDNVVSHRKTLHRIGASHLNRHNGWGRTGGRRSSGFNGFRSIGRNRNHKAATFRAQLSGFPGRRLLRFAMSSYQMLNSPAPRAPKPCPPRPTGYGFCSGRNGAAPRPAWRPRAKSESPRNCRCVRCRCHHQARHR